MEALDKLFQVKITEMKTLPSEVKWTKDKSWLKVKKKQQKYKRIRLLKYAAAIIVLLSVSYMVLIPNRDSINTANEDIEYQKAKELLKEMNKKIGVRGKIIYVCDNCINSAYYIEYIPYNSLPRNQMY